MSEPAPMKLQLLDRSSRVDASFSVKMNSYPSFLKVWHYHPELELVVILKSIGTRFIGDHIEKFEAGDVVLLGENLPHMWLSDEQYFEDSSDLVAEAIAIHFKKEFLGSEFFLAYEMKHIFSLLRKSHQGIKFVNVGSKVIEAIRETLDSEGFDRIKNLLSTLNLLANHSDIKLLSSLGFINSFGETKLRNLGKTYEFIFNNFNRKISLKDVADVANMNPSAFSRFFTKTNRKTFSHYLNEIRIGYACKMLMDDRCKISTVCYDSGFNNISNFNRQFRAIMKMSPSEYRVRQLRSE